MPSKIFPPQSTQRFPNILMLNGDRPNMVEKLWGKEPASRSLLSYASADVSATGSLPKLQNPMLGPDEDVWALQKGINQLGFTCGTDGIFGPQTDKLVKEVDQMTVQKEAEIKQV